MVIIGADPHKRTHTVADRRLAERVSPVADVGGWLRSQRWAVENAGDLGRHPAHWLLARGGVAEDLTAVVALLDERRNNVIT